MPRETFPSSPIGEKSGSDSTKEKEKRHESERGSARWTAEQIFQNYFADSKLGTDSSDKFAKKREDIINFIQNSAERWLKVVKNEDLDDDEKSRQKSAEINRLKNSLAEIKKSVDNFETETDKEKKEDRPAGAPGESVPSTKEVEDAVEFEEENPTIASMKMKGFWAATTGKIKNFGTRAGFAIATAPGKMIGLYNRAILGFSDKLTDKVKQRPEESDDDYKERKEKVAKVVVGIGTAATAAALITGYVYLRKYGQEMLFNTGDNPGGHGSMHNVFRPATLVRASDNPGGHGSMHNALDPNIGDRGDSGSNGSVHDDLSPILGDRDGSAHDESLGVDGSGIDGLHDHLGLHYDQSQDQYFAEGKIRAHNWGLPLESMTGDDKYGVSGIEDLINNTGDSPQRDAVTYYELVKSDPEMLHQLTSDLGLGQGANEMQIFDAFEQKALTDGNWWQDKADYIQSTMSNGRWSETNVNAIGSYYQVEDGNGHLQMAYDSYVSGTPNFHDGSIRLVGMTLPSGEHVYWNTECGQIAHPIDLPVGNGGEAAPVVSTPEMPVGNGGEDGTIINIPHTPDHPAPRTPEQPNVIVPDTPQEQTPPPPNIPDKPDVIIPDTPSPETPTPDTPTPEVPNPPAPSIPEQPGYLEPKNPAEDINVNPNLNPDAVKTTIVGPGELQSYADTTKPADTVADVVNQGSPVESTNEIAGPQVNSQETADLLGVKNPDQVPAQNLAPAEVLTPENQTIYDSIGSVSDSSTESQSTIETNISDAIQSGNADAEGRATKPIDMSNM